jgi:hypothetical protein
VVSFTVFQTHQLWLPVAVPLLIQSPVALVVGLALGHWQASQERNRVRQAVMKGITGFVTREPGSFRLVGKEQAVTLYELLGWSGPWKLCTEGNHERLSRNRRFTITAYNGIVCFCMAWPW